MAFTLRIINIKYGEGEVVITGRLEKGSYFGPEQIVIPLEDGSFFQSVVVGMSAKDMKGWPIEPEHDSTLHLNVYNPENIIGFLVGGLAQGIGIAQNSNKYRKHSNELLANPYFWSSHYYMLLADEDNSEDELLPLFFDQTLEELNRFYEKYLSGKGEGFQWPFFTKQLPDSSMIEVEYSCTVEYQIRYKIITSNVGESILMGYESGHFSLPGFRWQEIKRIASCHRQVSNSLSSAECLLLLFPAVYVYNDDDIEKIKDSLCQAWQQLGIVNEKHLSGLVSNIIANRTVESMLWQHSEEFGWINNSPYSQRNSDSKLSEMPKYGWMLIDQFFQTIEGFIE